MFSSSSSLSLNSSSSYSSYSSSSLSSSSLPAQPPMNAVDHVQEYNHNLVQDLQNYVPSTSSAEELDHAIEHFEAFKGKIDSILTILKTVKNNRQTASSLQGRVSSDDGKKSTPVSSKSNPSSSSTYSDPYLTAATPKSATPTPSSSSLMTTESGSSSSLTKPMPNISAPVAIDPFGFTAIKLDLPADFIRAEFEGLKKYYATSYILATCKIRPIQGKDEVAILISSVARTLLCTFLTTQMDATQVDIDNLFQYRGEGKDRTCTVEFRGEVLAQGTSLDKNEIAKLALSVFEKHPIYFEKCLITAPADDLNPLAPIMDFFHANNPLFSFDEPRTLIPTYSSRKIKDKSEKEVTLFGCGLSYNGKEIVKVSAEFASKIHARAKASILASVLINRAIQMPKEIYFDRLQTVKQFEAAVPILLIKLGIPPLVNVIRQYLSSWADYQSVETQLILDSKPVAEAQLLVESNPEAVNEEEQPGSVK